MAMLAKQRWRVMNEDSSLLHQVLKAKYFPTTDFRNAQLGVLMYGQTSRYQIIVSLNYVRISIEIEIKG